MENEKAMIVKQEQMFAPMTAETIRAQVNLIQQVMNSVMQGPSKENPDGVHYGVIPGCKKPSLYKPGAEKLFLTFRLRPIIDPVNDIIITELPNGHRDYRVHCHILNMAGVEMATGVGSASTMETKHRYRGGLKIETENPVPAAYWNLKKEEKTKEALALIGGPGFGVSKGEKGWVICEMGAKQENPDIADQYNTVLKMACKRAKVDGCLSATACSDIFTQDIEDFSHITGEPIGKPATTENVGPTAEETEALRQKKAEEYAKANPEGHLAPLAPKSEPRASQPPPEGFKTIIGCLKAKSKPNKGGYVGYTLENHKDIFFNTNDKILMETLDEKMKAGKKVCLEYNTVVNGKFTNHNITGLVQVEEKGESQEPLPF